MEARISEDGDSYRYVCKYCKHENSGGTLEEV